MPFHRYGEGCTGVSFVYSTHTYFIFPQPVLILSTDEHSAVESNSLKRLLPIVGNHDIHYWPIT